MNNRIIQGLTPVCSCTRVLRFTIIFCLISIIYTGQGYAQNARIDTPTEDVILGDDQAFTGNVTSSFGGAINARNVTLGDNAEFTENEAGTTGGAIFANGGVTLGDNAMFTKNEAGSSGGAISASGGIGTVIVMFGDNAAFTGNSANGGGGAIYIYRGNVILGDNATFMGNTAGYSGAINASNTVTLGNNATFQWNTAASRGGAINADFVVTLGDNAMFQWNTAAINGGAIHLSGVSFAILTLNGKATFSSNTADQGGAIYAYANQSLTITGTGTIAFSGNTASEGGAIWAGGTINVGNGVTLLCDIDTDIHTQGLSFANGSTLAVDLTRAVIDGGTVNLIVTGGGTISGTTALDVRGFATRFSAPVAQCLGAFRCES